MAQPMLCDGDDGNPAVMLVTNLETGDGNAWCPAHVPAFAKSLAEATGVLMIERAEAAAEALKKAGYTEDVAGGKAKGRGARKATAAQDTGDAGASTPAPENDERTAGEKWAETTASIQTDETGHPL